MTPFRLGWMVAAVALILDQATKFAAMAVFGISVRELIDLAPQVDLFPVGMSFPLTPFFNLTVTWNRGISYGLLQQEAGLGRWMLVVFSFVAAAVLGWWMRKAQRRLVAFSYGLIVGGALGNAWDRLAYGAVFDFAHFHVGTFSWYVFNIADAAIVFGVVGLMWDAIFPARQSAPSQSDGS